VLSDDNRALLEAIREMNPESISALAEATGRKAGNLSRTLKTTSQYGIVQVLGAAPRGRTKASTLRDRAPGCYSAIQ
jgi:predicted transcriptional regulator